ncbi:MAG: RlmE family RNA methyltransferase [Candidatus Nitrosocaldus sp.]|nr:RlmE family RNA methyltransferase [Candidatus Nitrosocaldus sp.]MDW7999694.1 RlmE family RNA methyltransferase [Candidatus Nitrosocaldus sp.]
MRLEEARRDQYRRLAKEEGYRSRAAYKLLEINRSFHIFRRGDKVLDIGCYPGGWLQVAGDAVGMDGLVIGVDVREIGVDGGSGRGRGQGEEDGGVGGGFGANIRFIRMSVEDDALAARIRAVGVNGTVDVILSDVSPNLSGIWSLDHARQIHLSRRVLDLARVLLKHDGIAVLKVFDGDMLREFINDARRCFKRVYVYKPKASRKESSELYLVCKGFQACS